MNTITTSDLQGLTALLRANMNSKTVSACLAALQSGEPVSREGHTRPLPLADILSTYRFRAQINADRDGVITGFPELLAGLEQLSDTAVRVLSLGFSGVRYLVFTNNDSTQLAGVLQIPMPHLGLQAAEPVLAGRLVN